MRENLRNTSGSCELRGRELLMERADDDEKEQVPEGYGASDTKEDE